MAREQRQPRASCRTREISAGSEELGNKAASVLQRTAKYRHHQPKRQLCMSSVLRWVLGFNASKITVGTEFTMPPVKWGQCIKLMGSAEGEKKTQQCMQNALQRPWLGVLRNHLSVLLSTIMRSMETFLALT